jgi:hypothetical protein
MEAGGFEPTPQNSQGIENKDVTENKKTDTAQKLPKSGNSDIKSIVENCPELEQIITAWPELPEHIRAAIRSLIQANTKGIK